MKISGDRQVGEELERKKWFVALIKICYVCV